MTVTSIINAMISKSLDINAATDPDVILNLQTDMFNLHTSLHAYVNANILSFEDYQILQKWAQTTGYDPNLYNPIVLSTQI